MVSYKKLYDELKEKVESEEETDYICPDCNSSLLLTYTGELYCSNNECKFDKTLGDILLTYTNAKNIESKW